MLSVYSDNDSRLGTYKIFADRMQYAEQQDQELMFIPEIPISF